jgi:hypothetical protein
MRTLWAILLGGLALIGTAEARLGETKEQLEQRFGKGTEENILNKYKKINFTSEKYLFSFLIVNGKAEEFVVMKTDGDLTSDEINGFLKKNSLGSGFRRISKRKYTVLSLYEEQESGRTAVQDMWSLTIRTPLGLAVAKEIDPSLKTDDEKF